MATLEAFYGVPEETPVVQLFLPGIGGQFGEIRRSADRMEVELWNPAGKATWIVDAEELANAIELAKRKLLGGTK